MLRGPGGRPAQPAAPGRRTSGRARRRRDGQPHPALVAGKRGRAGYDGAKRKKGTKLHAAVDTLGNLLAVHVTPADTDDRAAVGPLSGAVQAVTEGAVEKAFVDQGYTGQRAAAAAEQHGIELDVVRLPEAKRGFVLLPRRWVVERSFAWVTRFRRLAKDYERLPSTIAGLHMVAFACLMLRGVAQLAAGS